MTQLMTDEPARDLKPEGGNPAAVMARLFRRDADGSHYLNVSTPTPQPLQNVNTTPGSSPDGNTTVYIVIGVVIPVVLIGIGALIFYVWYRKKYPVRMVMGKDFNKFSNPAYNKRNSTLTLVREDAANYWDTFQPTGIQNPGLSLVLEDEDDGFPGETHVDVIDETDASVKIENIEKMIENGVGNITNNKAEANVAKEDAQEEHGLQVSENETKADDTKRSKPKKALLIKNDDEFLDAGFEIVSESDLGSHTDSDRSSANDSTGTHTITLSIAGTIETDEASETSKYDANLTSNRESTGFEPSQSRSVESSTKPTGEFEEGDKHALDGETDVEEKQENDVLSEKDETLREHSDVENLKNEASKIKSETLLEPNDTESDTIQSDVPFTETARETHRVEDTSNRDFDQSLTDTETDSNGSKKAIKLTLSANNICFESVPPTPVVVPDSIIFEPEMDSPVVLDNTQETFRRQRRAHTIECVMSSLQTHKKSEHAAKKEWFSFDDIDKLVDPKEGTESFNAILKTRRESLPLRERDISDMEVTLPTFTASDKDSTVLKNYKRSSATDSDASQDSSSSPESESGSSKESSSSIDIGRSISDKAEANVEEMRLNDSDTQADQFQDREAVHFAQPQENASPLQEDYIDTSLSLSFEVIDDNSDKHSTVILEESFKSEDSYALFPLSNDYSDVSIEKPVDKSAKIDLPVTTTEERVDENTYATVEEKNTNPTVDDASIEVIESLEENQTSGDNALLLNINAATLLTATAPGEDIPATEKDAEDHEIELTFGNEKEETKTTNIADIKSTRHTAEEDISESQSFTDSATDLSFVQIADVRETEYTEYSTGDNTRSIPDKPDILNFNEPVRANSSDVSLLLDLETPKDNSAGTFQQFESAFLNASTPTTSMNNPLAEFKPDLVDIDTEFPNMPNSNSDSSDSFSLADATASLDKSFDEDTINKLIGETSPTNSFEIIDNDNSKPESSQPKKKITVAVDFAAFDDDDESETGKDSSDSGDFQDLLVGKDHTETASPSSGELDLIAAFPSAPDTGALPTRTVKGSWDVLHEDTEA